MSAKIQISISISDERMTELKKQRDETGISISRLIDLDTRGYKLVKFKEVEVKS